MWIVTKSRLRQYWKRHPDTRSWLENWYQVASRTQWKALADVRKTFPHADSVKVGSGKSATVFNVCGNKHRMITAIHYNTGKIFMLRLMSHAEYSRGSMEGTGYEHATTLPQTNAQDVRGIGQTTAAADDPRRR